MDKTNVVKILGDVELLVNDALRGNNSNTSRLGGVFDLQRTEDDCTLWLIYFNKVCSGQDPIFAD